MILLQTKSKKTTKVDREEEVKWCQQKPYVHSSEELQKNPKTIKFVKVFERKTENHTYLLKMLNIRHYTLMRHSDYFGDPCSS